MTNRRTKIAERGVSDKPIALRLPRDIRDKAEQLAAQEGVSLNRHATAAYLRGIADQKSGEQA
ncbi:hypothetical protein [Methylophilus sp. 3sh_L]|uniref:hypothetical protein n=1 Tax=Methylophilus sp. 3sh_L TaxID=3377114 RepID=UPI00398E9121